MNMQYMTQELQAVVNTDSRLYRAAADLLARADIHLNGEAAWDMQLRKPGVQCVGVTISKEQAEYARSLPGGANLDFRLQDYRDMHERFDRIVSIGMFEHVGHKNHRTYMEVAHRCLEDDGLFLLHTIGKNKRQSTSDPWIDKYIFQNGDLPSIGQIGDAMDDLFVAEDLHNFGADYDKTLMAWHANFEQAWPRFADQLGERFRRMWSYYLLSCAGAFRARDLQLWQPMLGEWLIGMSRDCPKTALRAEVDNPARLLDAVHDGSLDLAVLYNPPQRPGLVSELLAEEKLVMLTTSPDGQMHADAYVYVDWGPSFAANHQAAFPELSSPPVSISLGPLALVYLREVGGASYFRVGMARPYIEAGQLFRVHGTPESSHSAYAVYAVQRDNPTLDRARACLRAVAERWRTM